jgi:hypothetical protein
MKLATRIMLKRERRRAIREGNAEREALCNLALQDEDIEALVHEASYYEFQYEQDLKDKSEAKGDRVFGNPFTEFLQWLFDNREAILEFILTIAQIFAILEPNPEG